MAEQALQRDGRPGAVAPVLRLRAVAKRFPDGSQALDPVDLEVARGEFLTLLGPSGCGKSTLLRLMSGLIAPSSGTLERAAARLGFVFQEPTLMPWATVSANVRLPLDLAGRPAVQSAPQVEAALASVGLAAFAGHRPRQLSGGMRMRVSIARALVDEPELLLMDEPFGALDEITRHKLDADLLALWRARGLTVVFVTHSIAEAVFLSTRVLVMSPHPGRVIGEVRIDGTGPRDAEFRLGEGFAAHSRQLMQLLAEGASR